MLPEASVYGRKISDEVEVLYHRSERLVEARFKTKRQYLHPKDAPRFSRLTGHHGRWHADIEVQAFAPEEAAALEQLRERLRERGLEVPPVIAEVIEELRKLQPPTDV